MTAASVSIPVSHENFAPVIAARLGGQVTDIDPVRGGMGHRMYLAMWECDGQANPITIRCFRGVRALDEARNEAGALRELCSDNYPVPELYGLFDSPDIPEAPFTVLQYVPGEPLTKIALSEPDRIPYWLERASDLLLRLHGVKWESGYEWLKPVLTHLGYAERMITWWGSQASDLDLDSDPELRAGFEWLRTHKYMTRAATQQVLVHRDFHSDNLISDGKKIVSVIDWADLRIADPAVDVGWTRMILHTEAPSGLAELFLNSYTRRNPDVTRTLPYWEVFAAVKRIIQIDSIKTQQSERIGIWSGAGGLNRLQNAEAGVRQFLLERLTEDEN